MTIQEQYKNQRHLIKDGDVILFSGTGLVASIIRMCDRNSDKTKAKHSHVGIVVESHGALFIVDSNAKGVQADRLSWRVNNYTKKASFTVLRPLASKVEVNLAMQKLLKRSDDKWIKYDFKNGIKELCNRRFGTKFKIYLNDEKDICSDYISMYVIILSMMKKIFMEKVIVFPEDFKRDIDTDNAMVICEQL